jgi:hypothetical protein
VFGTIERNEYGLFKVKSRHDPPFRRFPVETLTHGIEAFVLGFCTQRLSHPSSLFFRCGERLIIKPTAMSERGGQNRRRSLATPSRDD